MDENLINIKTAELAKEKGFSGDCGNYRPNGEYTFGNSDNFYPAPTQGLLQKWLREIHNLNIFMSFKPNIKKWDYMVYDMNMNAIEYIQFANGYRRIYPDRRFDTYEIALESGLVEALNLIK